MLKKTGKICKNWKNAEKIGFFWGKTGKYGKNQENAEKIRKMCKKLVFLGKNRKNAEKTFFPGKSGKMPKKLEE